MKRQAVIPAPSAVVELTPVSATVPTILDIKQARQRSERVVVASRNAIVCRFWTEKLLLVVDALQLYALLWQLSQPWPWPARWLRWTRWTNAFNGDAFSFRATGAAMGATSQPFSLWGEMRHYWLYALAFGAAPHVLVGALWVVSWRWKSKGHEDFLARRCLWANALVHVLYVIFLPVGLAVMRLINCDADGRVSVDPYMFPTCWSMAHLLAVVAITGIAGGSFLVLFPWWLHRMIQRATFTQDTAEHERYVGGIELSYLLGISDTYMDLYMPQFSSFQARGIHTLLYLCVAKIVLLVVFSLLRSPPPSPANQGLQGSLFFAVLLALAWGQTARPVFRIESTNQLAKLLAWLLVANGIIALLCANGVRSALTVSTSVTSSLTFLNLVVISTIALSLGHSVKRWVHRGDLTPLPGAILRAEYPCWPTHPFMDEVISERFPVENWMHLLRDARALSVQTAIAAPMMKPFHDLAQIATELEACWRAAKASDHLLAVHLHQELLLLSDLLVEAVATSPFKGVDLLEEYQADFISLADRLRRRDNTQRLLPAVQRRVTSKLRATKTWASIPESVDEEPVMALLRKHVSMRATCEGEEWVDIKSCVMVVHPTMLDGAGVHVKKWNRQVKQVQIVSGRGSSHQHEVDYLTVALEDIQAVGCQLKVVDGGDPSLAELTEDLLRAFQCGGVAATTNRAL